MATTTGMLTQRVQMGQSGYHLLSNLPGPLRMKVAKDQRTPITTHRYHRNSLMISLLLNVNQIVLTKSNGRCFL
jgi:hypothetical protein